MKNYFSISKSVLFNLIYFFVSSILFPQSHSISDSIKKELSSDFFKQLYSNTYFSILDRIDEEGYFQESLSGHYDGMYCRTVGALIPLLIETKEYSKAKLLLKFVLKVMKQKKMNRVPHVIGKEKFNGKDSIFIIGKTDQIDGQAHFILAWSQLALASSSTIFEDTTWNFISELMNRSTEKPYFGSKEKGKISNLIYNFNFEHSRSIPTNYDLLTQCFIGSALNSMMKVAKRRNDLSNFRRWNIRIDELKNGINNFLTKSRNGKKIYIELLEKKNGDNLPFDGLSWVNLSPVAAQWNPLEHNILVNTINFMQSNMIKKWNDIKWLPTQWNYDNTFSNQMIGKGIGWELEFVRNEKNWKRVLEILKMLKVVQNDKTIFMENSYLTTGNNYLQKFNDKELIKYDNGIWKIVDAGNGEQAAWWCWAFAKLRKEFGLIEEPSRLIIPPEMKILEQNTDSAKVKLIKMDDQEIYYTIDGSTPNKNSIIYSENITIGKPATIKTITYQGSKLSNINSIKIPGKYSGLEFTYFTNFKDSVNNESKILANGYIKNFRKLNDLKSDSNSILIEEGYIKINRAGNYKYYLLANENAKLFIDEKLVSSVNNKVTQMNLIDKINLCESMHTIKLELGLKNQSKDFEIYYSYNNGVKEKLDSNMLLFKKTNSKNILRPQISPFKMEFDKDEKILVKINSIDDGEIFYSVDGHYPNIEYEKPFQITKSCVVKAITKNGKQISPVAVMNYMQTEKTQVKFINEPDRKYNADGPLALVDGKYGTTNLSDGNWLGFNGEDLDVTIDLRKVKLVNKIKTEFLNNPNSWIFLPKELKIFTSIDGKNFTRIFETKIDPDEQKIKNAEIKVFKTQLNNKRIRFIRIFAENIKVCPKWHPGDGNKAWLFIDEISIK